MRLITVLICLFTINSCDRSEVNENCKFLLDIGVNTSINLTLPEYGQLKFAGNSVYIANAGNGGIIVAFTGGDYFAWDAADPNHEQRPCSVLVNSGLEATCGCDDKNKFSLVNGQPLNNANLACSLRNYRVELNGNTLLIFN